MQKFCEAFVFLVIIIVSNICSVIEGKPHKRVVIHVPMKVKHIHHTHTVYKPIHHAIPVKLEEPEIHLVRPEKPGWDDNDDYEPFGYGHGRSIIGDVSKIQLVNANYDDEDRKAEYQNFENYLKRRLRNKQKLFNNNVIGWKGRPNYDKIANEFLLHIKNNPSPDYNDYDQRYAPYEDEDDERK